MYGECNVTSYAFPFQVSLNRCNPPVDIANGTVSYTNDDTSNIFVGDVITYDCEEGCELLGPEERHCMRDGNWSGAQPICRTIGESHIMLPWQFLGQLQ